MIIKRGNVVASNAHIGAAEITTAEQALQDGTAEQVIRVQNISYGKTIGANVLDEGTVIVLEK